MKPFGPSATIYLKNLLIEPFAMDQVGLVDWLNHCDTQLAKKTENSNTRKKLVGKKFSYSRSRIGTSNTFVVKDYCKVIRVSPQKCRGEKSLQSA